MFAVLAADSCSSFSLLASELRTAGFVLSWCFYRGRSALVGAPMQAPDLPPESFFGIDECAA
ncbi:hypothetical protein [Chitinimonas lacunae]|uniref:Uncharacterized protein n=1 Tax=Chitinimonas lacunae TaxID=1963018 RepID=A0ABV8MUR0_9NEIS